MVKPGKDGKFSGIIPPVARLPRVVVVDVAHHVTQRGNGFILASDSECRWACGSHIEMKAVDAVVPAKPGTQVGWIPAPRLRGDKLRGNDVTFDGADGYLGLLGRR